MREKILPPKEAWHIRYGVLIIGLAVLFGLGVSVWFACLSANLQDVALVSSVFTLGFPAWLSSFLAHWARIEERRQLVWYDGRVVEASTFYWELFRSKVLLYESGSRECYWVPTYRIRTLDPDLVEDQEAADRHVFPEGLRGRLRDEYYKGQCPW